MRLTYRNERAKHKDPLAKQETHREDTRRGLNPQDVSKARVKAGRRRKAHPHIEQSTEWIRCLLGAPDAWRRVLAQVLCPLFWACLVTAGQAATSFPGAVLRADYQFQNTLTSPVPPAPALVSLGNDTFGNALVDGRSSTVLNFGMNDGLLLGTPGLVPNGNYSVAVLFSFTEVSGWRRILDLKNRTSDDGLYSYNGALNFYPVALGTSAPVSSNEFVQVVLTRDLSQNVVGYVDGVQQIAFVDTNGLAIMDSTNPLAFFRDDLVYPNEASPGTVARIRLYDDALSPSEVAALDRLPGATIYSNTIPADLQVTKSADQYTVDVGNVVTFTIVVSNSGPGSVANVLVPESLSPGWALLGVTNGPNASFDLVNTRWTIFSLPPYASERLQLQAQAIAPGPLSNRVDVVPPPGVPDPNPANNTSALAVMAVQAQADLKLTKVANTNLSEVTNAISFDVTIENLGPDAAKSITVKEQLPRDLYVTDAQPPNGTAWDPPTRTWTIPNLAVNAKLTLKVSVLPLRGGMFTNTAAIISAQPADPNPDNNQASTQVQFVGYAACGVASLCTFGGAPHANATVTLIPPNNLLTTATLATKTDAQGVFCLTGLLAGTYTLRVTPADPASGITTSEQPVDIGPDTGALNPWSKFPIITGLITFGPGGPPYPNVNVTVTDGTVQKTVMTDQNGVYVVTGLDEKQYKVTPQAPVAGLSCFPVSSNVIVGAGGVSCPARADFRLQGTLKIEGRLTTCQGTAVIPYASVSLSTEAFANLRTYGVGTDGRYSFTNLPPGTYTIMPTHPTYTFAPASQKATLAKNNVVLNFAGTANNGVIGGRVFSRNRAPIANVTITLLDLASGRNVNTTTAADGSFIFNNVPAGNYSVTPTPPQPGFVFTPPFAAGAVGGANPSCNNYPLFVGSLNAVELVALEAVQVVQDWQNNLPLVEGKPTLIRAFLKPAGTNTQPVRVNNATLLVQSGATTKTLRPRADIDARADYASRRNDPKTSLAFDLPTSLAKGQVTFTLQWPAGVLTTYMDPAGQQIAVRNNSTTVKFQATPALPLKWVLVNWKFGGTTVAANNGLVTTQQKRLIAGLPTVSIPAGKGNLTSLDWSPPKDPKNVATKEDIEEIRNHLQAQLARKRRLDEFNPNRSKTIYHGVLSGTAITGQAGDVPAKTCFADMSEDPTGRDKNLPTHELGHTLGRHHDVYSAFGITVKAGLQLKTGLCAETAPALAPDYPMDQHNNDALAPTLGPMQLGDYRYGYGWDSSDNSYVSTFSTADIMSYCQWTTKWEWTGIPTYTNLFSALNSRFGPAVLPAPFRKQDLEIPTLLISGEVEMTSGTLSLDPILQLLRTEAPTLPETGPYTLLLLDGAGNVLAQVPFSPTVPVIEEDESSTLLYGYFTLEIPQVVGLAAVEILDQNRVLTNRTVSLHQPAAQFITPLSGALLTNDPVTLSWSGFHPDGLPLSYILQYSTDSGTNWETLALDLATNQFRIASTMLRGATNAFFRIIVTDGLNQSTTLVGPVRVPDHAPQVGILEPSPGTVFVGPEPVVLRASAWDLEDGELPPSQLRWNDSVSGDLGAGDEVSLDASQLSEGDHLIQVTATDSAGNQTTSTVNITIQRLANVPLTAQRVGDQIQLSWPSSASTLSVWAAFSLDSPEWFLLEGQPVESGDSFVLNVPILEDTLFFRLAGP